MPAAGISSQRIRFRKRRTLAHGGRGLVHLTQAAPTSAAGAPQTRPTRAERPVVLEEHEVLRLYGVRRRRTPRSEPNDNGNSDEYDVDEVD